MQLFSADSFWNLVKFQTSATSSFALVCLVFFSPYYIQFHQLFLFFDYETMYCSTPVLLPQNKFCQQQGSKN